MRRLLAPDPGWFLERDGSNLASVIETTHENEEEIIERVGRYLSAITGSVELLDVVKYGEYETVRFRVPRNDRGQPLEFDAASMSDGTCVRWPLWSRPSKSSCRTVTRASSPSRSRKPHSIQRRCGIGGCTSDEATVRELRFSSRRTAPSCSITRMCGPKMFRVVEMIDGQTVIGPVDEASVEIIRRRLNTLGGLERENQLELDLDDRERQQRLGESQQESPP